MAFAIRNLAAPLILVGGGKMGDALAKGWLAAGLAPSQLAVVEPDPARRAQFAGLPGVRTAPSVAELPRHPPARALVLALKPQVMDEAAPPCRPLIGSDTLILSIAAGKPVAAFEGYFGAAQPIVRAMPNTPAAVGRGVSVLCRNAATTSDDQALATALMTAVGRAFWVDDEDLLHAVTALSGSGPAYVFHLIEAMAAAGEALGLPPDLALNLARGTVEGAGELAHHSPESPTELRRNVTSPGGTTQAALDILMPDPGLTTLLTQALTAATRRSRELA